MHSLYAKLELRFGLLRAVTPRYTNWVYKPSHHFERVIKADPSDIEKAIFELSRDRKNGLKSIDIPLVAETVGVNRELVIRKLEAWNRQRVIELRCNGTISRYRMLKPFPQDPLEERELIDMAHNEVRAHKLAEMKRSQMVVDLVTGGSCFARSLAEYFGDEGSVPKKGCGKCQWCLTKERVVLNYPRKSHVDQGRIRAVLEGCPDTKDPELLAKLAFGISSPKILMATTGTSHRLRGSMKDCDFDVCNPIPL